MTEALVQINDRIALSPLADQNGAVMFFCECGHCLAAEVSLTLDEHDEIRAREDLIFAPDHETAGCYRKPNLGHGRPPASRASRLPGERARELEMTSVGRLQKLLA